MRSHRHHFTGLSLTLGRSSFIFASLDFLFLSSQITLTAACPDYLITSTYLSFTFNPISPVPQLQGWLSTMKTTLFARVTTAAGSSSVNPRCELNPRAKRQCHKWKAEERILLCCMRRWFNFDRKQEAAIFDSVFGARARTEGFENGLPSSTLVTQWEDLGKRAHKDWIDVHERTNFAEGPSSFRNVLDRIQNASSALRIPVLRRSTDIDIRKFSRFREPLNQLARADPPAQSHSIQVSSDCNWATGW
jgi:hypothetical protein